MGLSTLGLAAGRRHGRRRDGGSGWGVPSRSLRCRSSFALSRHFLCRQRSRAGLDERERGAVDMTEGSSEWAAWLDEAELKVSLYATS